VIPDSHFHFTTKEFSLTSVPALCGKCALYFEDRKGARAFDAFWNGFRYKDDVGISCPPQS
jgi:hypothetical protein